MCSSSTIAMAAFAQAGKLIGQPALLTLPMHRQKVSLHMLSNLGALGHRQLRCQVGQPLVLDRHDSLRCLWPARVETAGSNLRRCEPSAAARPPPGWQVCARKLERHSACISWRLCVGGQLSAC